MTVFDTDAHVEECEETFAALQDRPKLAGAAPRVIEGERRTRNDSQELRDPAARLQDMDAEGIP